MMLKTYKHLPWPLNLWSAVFLQEVSAEELPGDWEQALEYVFRALRSTKRRDILIAFFRDDLTLQEIGDIYGTTSEPIRQHAEKALRAMRHPTKKIFLYIGLENGKAAISKGQEAAARSAADDRAIAALGLSVRAWNCLKRAGIDTIDQLTGRTERELTMFRNMGAGTLQEIKGRLADRGLTLLP